MDEQITKTCKYCFQDKSIKDFTPNKRMTDNYNNKCKKCANRYSLFRLSVNNIYLPSTLEWELYDYFCRHWIHLEPKEIEDVVNELKMADNFWTCLREIEKKYDICASLYQNNLSETRYF